MFAPKRKPITKAEQKALSETSARRLRVENEVLRRIVADLHWMARRYAHGRSSYAVGLLNDHTRALLGLGVKLNPTGDNTIWATDGQFGPPPEAKDNPANVLKEHEKRIAYCNVCEKGFVYE